MTPTSVLRAQARLPAWMIVRPTKPDFRTNAGARWRLAAMFVIALGQQGGVAAASVTSAPKVVADEHGRHCRCGSACKKTSCCCGPKSSKAANSSKIPSRFDSRPCLENAPCGDSGLPTPPTVGPIGKAATLGTIGLVVPDETGRLLPPPARLNLPARRAFRLDDPPESLPFA